MTQKTKPEIWPTDKPFVVFMVPVDRAQEYGTMMNRLLMSVLYDLKWEPGSIETFGLIVSTPQNGIENLYFLEEIGVSTRTVTLLMLWGETAMCVDFQHVVPEACGVGKVIFPGTGVVLPAVRMPSLNGNWWDDPLHREFAAITITNLVRDKRRVEFDGSEPYNFVTRTATWN